MTKTDLEDLLASYLQAEKDILSGKTVSWNGRQLQRENLSEIRKGRHEVESRLAQLNPRARTRPQYSLAKFV